MYTWKIFVIEDLGQTLLIYNFFDTFLNNNTVQEPSKFKKYVNVVASNANNIGFTFNNTSIYKSPFYNMNWV